MSKLIVLRGLPGSGKSTKAKEIVQQDHNAVRVNKDALRDMLFFISKSDHSEWSNKRENIVKKAQLELVRTLLAKHKTVIIDDTNLNQNTVRRWEDVALQGNHKFQIITIDTDVEECIKRDALRDITVGEEVIRKFASVHHIGNNKADDQKAFDCPDDKKIVIYDLDGTLADVEHRLHFINGGVRKDWAGFFDGMSKDPLREGVASLITDCYKDHITIIVTGRPSNYRTKTEKWLKKHNIPYKALYMRKAGDFRPDYIVKQEILDKFLPKDKIEMIVDDRKCVLDMWRSNRLPVIDVGDGTDF
jgi:predicted kinase